MNLPVTSLDLSAYSEEDLLVLRTRIDAQLNLDLADIDLSSELVLLFKQTRIAMQSANEDDDAPLNHKNQLVNSAAALLKQLTDGQKALFNTGTIQRMERALLHCLRQLPEPQQRAFMAEYEGVLND